MNIAIFINCLYTISTLNLSLYGWKLFHKRQALFYTFILLLTFTLIIINFPQI